MIDVNHDSGTRYVGVGHVAAAVGCCVQTIRNLERTGVVPTAARVEPGGRRMWPASDVDIIRARVEQRTLEKRQGDGPERTV